MMMKTKQVDFWSGEFGQEYTDRNTFTKEEWEKFYLNNWGISKKEMNHEFISGLSPESRILEVGSNIGLQLNCLQEMGFKNLFGIELQWYAVEKAKELTKGINLIQGSGFDIPFRDNYFDLVCTNGVLIHIAPENLGKIMDEMYRCSSKYIWGFEYFAPEITEINYRGNKGFLWKADYCKLFMERFPDLKLVKNKNYPYISSAEAGNKDAMYLLEKI